MKGINAYLNFVGNTEEAFNFYKSVFGGEFLMLQRFKDTPEADNVPESDKDKIMHVSLPVGDSILMGTDSIESMGQKFVPGNNISLSIDVESEDEARRVFDGLAAGGKIEMPLEKAFWNAYFGMLTDKFGIQWMINYQYPEKA